MTRWVLVLVLVIGLAVNTCNHKRRLQHIKEPSEKRYVPDTISPGTVYIREL